MRNQLSLAFAILAFASATHGCEKSGTKGSATGGANATAGASSTKASGGAGQGGGSVQSAGAGTASGGANTAGNVATGVGGAPVSGGAASAGASSTTASGSAGASAAMSFFVSSDTSATANLGGLVGADARCQRLAAAAGYGTGTWRAYLSAEHDPANGDQPVNARDRIGGGPWYNRNGVMVASGLDALHASKGNAELFIDENGSRVNGQWAGSPTPNQHDILTGSNPDGTLMAGFTCESWTSSSATLTAQVGHSDGLGPSMNPNPPYDSWNSSHANGSCADTAPKGGAGKIYCFLVR